MKRALLPLILVVLAAAPAVAHPPGEAAASSEEIHPLLIGAEVPELTLKSGDGAAFDLNAAIGKKPTILIFYRGGW